MKYVLTLIGNQSQKLTAEHFAAAATEINHNFTATWLSADTACDLAFEADEAKGIETTLREKFRTASVDLALRPEEGRRKRLLVADMDSTIIQQECIDELAAELGIKPQIAAITERAMRGEIEFEPALRERVGLLKGLSVTALEKVYRERIVEMPGGRAMVATMRRHGATCALVSGGFTFFTERVADAVGFNLNQANTLLLEDGALTGFVAEPILGRDAKTEALLRLRNELKLAPHDTMAIGDGANDLGMIGEAGLGVAFHAKPVVAEAAAARIDHSDLMAMLYLQGYSDAEIVSKL